jgi:hypothetical protein
MILCDVLWDEPKLMCCGGVVDLEKVVVMAELDLKHTDALGWPDAWWHWLLQGFFGIYLILVGRSLLVK